MCATAGDHCETGVRQRKQVGEGERTIEYDSEEDMSLGELLQGDEGKREEKVRE